MKKEMDLDALQEALNNDGKISEEEREMLICRGIPERLLEAFEDGIVDAVEMRALENMGIPRKVIKVLEDGHMTDEEKAMIKEDLAQSMKLWREKQLKQMFETLSRRTEKKS